MPRRCQARLSILAPSPNAMSPAAATSAALALYLLLAAPLLLFSRAARVGAVLCGVLLLGIVALGAGWLGRGALAPHDIRDIESAALAGGGECAQVLQVLTEARVILDRRDPGRLVVARQFWSQLPSAVRDATVACADEARPADSAGGPIQVVER